VLPDVPTMEESGAKVSPSTRQAVAAPEGIAGRTSSQAAWPYRGLNDPTVKPKLLDLGFEIVGNYTRNVHWLFQAAEFARWKKVIEVGKITAD
jgi:hypothetical protein